MPARRAPDRLAPVATSGVSQSYRAESVRLYGGERPRFGIRQPASFQRLAPWLQPHGAPIFSRFLATFRIGGRGGTRTRVVRLMRPGWNLLQLPCHVCPRMVIYSQNIPLLFESPFGFSVKLRNSSRRSRNILHPGSENPTGLFSATPVPWRVAENVGASPLPHPPEGPAVFPLPLLSLAPVVRGISHRPQAPRRRPPSFIACRAGALIDTVSTQ